MSDSVFFILSKCWKNKNNNNYNKPKGIISQALDSAFKEKAIKYSQKLAKIKPGSRNILKKISFLLTNSISDNL